MMRKTVNLNFYITGESHLNTYPEKQEMQEQLAGCRVSRKSINIYISHLKIPVFCLVKALA